MSTRPRSARHSPRAPLTLLATMLLCAGASACGNARERTGLGSDARAGASAAAPPGNYLKSDEDNDNDDYIQPVKPGEPNDTFSPPGYGHPADRADSRAIAVLVKHYYGVAAAGNGGAACSLLYPALAAGLGEGGTRGGCATAMSSLFAEQHARLAADEVATMVVVAVRVKGDTAAATVGFRRMPVGIVRLRRQGRAWKMGALLDAGLT